MPDADVRSSDANDPVAVRAPSTPGSGSGSPRNPEVAAKLERFNRRMKLPIVLSAVLPLLIVPGSGGWVGDVIGVVTWLVFVLDFVVQSTYRIRYVRTGFGVFDLAVVVLTAPWYLIPGLGGARFALLLRLARLVRLVIATRGVRRLVERLGRVALVAFGMVFLGSAVAYHAEHPTNPGFATFGDALWWGIVTLTTVGYGDIVPKTSTGRWAGVAIMLTGVAVLGVLAGSMSSFFRLAPPEPGDEASDGTEEADDDQAQTAAGSTEALTHEVAELRRQIADLTAMLTPPETTK